MDRASEQSNALDADTVRTIELAVNRLFHRRRLASALGQEAYGGARQYNAVLGYPIEIGIAQYVDRYERQDIARRIVDLPATDTWRKPPIVSSENAAFVDAWSDLVNRLGIWERFTRADRLSGIGRFGGLVLGIVDGGALSEPVKAVSGPDKLIYVRAFGEMSAAITEFDTDPTSERYGQPVLYQITNRNGATFVAHWTRVIHLAEAQMVDDVYGTPRLQVVYNRLDDLLKLVGGSAEASWLNMRPGTVITNQPDYSFADDKDTERQIEQQIEEYLHDVARVLRLEGVDVKTVQGQMLDPRGGFEVTLNLIAAATGIPQRVLLGSAAGELASAQEDTRQWHGTIAARQKNWAEPVVLRPFISRMVEYGVLPDAEYGVEWPPLSEQTAGEKAQTAKTWAEALRTMLEVPGGLEGLDALGLPSGVLPDTAATVAQNVASGAITANELADWLREVTR